MKKWVVRLLFTVFAAVGFALFIMFPNGFANEEEGQPAQEQGLSPGEERGLEKVQPKKTWDEAWRGYFGRDLPDPLKENEMSSEEWQRQRELAAQRGQAAAEFTQAATSVVTAGTPSPTAAAGAATQAIGEAAQGIVEAETTPAPEQPGVLRRIYNWFANWFK